MEHDRQLALGSLLRRHRESQGMTQEDLAERAGSGFSVDTISKIERGRTRPRRHTLQEQMAAFQLSEAERAEVLKAWRDAASPHADQRPSPRDRARGLVGGYLGVRPAGRLVARETELRRALSVLESVADRPARAAGLVLLAGEAGIGKTRLAQEVAVEAWRRDALVASGRCYEPQETIPFYPFLEALAALYEAGPREVSRLAAERWPYLARLLPEQLETQDAAPGTSPEEQQRLFRAVTGFVQAIAEATPVAIMLDDLHWADSASLDLLLYLARHTRGQRIFLLGTYRDVEIDRRHPLRAVLRDLIREQLVERIGLHALTKEETAALIGALMGEAVSDDLVDLVHARTEGNPFFVQQVVQSLVERGEAEAMGAGEVPESIRLVIQQRMGRLAEETQAILSEASVLGQTFHFEDLQKMGDHREADLEDALDEALETGLVRELGNDVYAFDHALTQQALYTELAGRRKRRLHRTAAEMLEQRHPESTRRAAEVAWHFLQSDDAERGLPYTLLAGDQAEAVFAHAEAERHYRTALELADSIGVQASEIEALEKLGGVLLTVGRYDEALGMLEQAAVMCRAAGDGAGTARVVARIGWLHLTQATYQEGIDRIQSLLESSRDGAEGWSAAPALIALWVVLSSLFLEQASYVEALAAAERAVEVAREVGDRQLVAQAEGRRGLALLLLGRREEARSVLKRVVPLAEAAYDLDTLNRALLNIAFSHLWAAEYDPGRQFLERALVLAERMGDPVRVANIGRNLGRFAFSAGKWEQARADLLRTTEALSRMGGSRAEARPLLGLGKIVLAEGKWEEATEKVEQAAALAEGAGDRVLLREVELARTELDLRRGRADVVIARLQPYLQGNNIGPYALIPEILILLTEAHLATGDVVAAEGLAAQALERARPLGLPWLHAAMRLQAAVLGHAERWHEAEKTFAAALTEDRAAHAVYEEGLLLYEYGLMQARRGDREQAQARWEEALVIFRSLGAGLFAEKTQQALEDLTGQQHAASAIRPQLTLLDGGKRGSTCVS